MLRTLSLARTHLRSLTLTLTPLSESLRPSSPFPLSSSPYSSSFSSSGKQKKNKEGEDLDDSISLFNRDPTSPPRLFLVQPRLWPQTFLQAKLNEALCLANSLEEQRDGYFDTDFVDKELPPHVIVQNPVLKSAQARADTYFGPGTVKNIKCHLNAAESKEEVDAVFVNAVLTGIQQRNLERAWGKPVLDRVGLIIEIFNAHAHTKEAKLQAELAALIYKKSRLVRVRGPDGRYTFGAVGEAEVVSARGRGSGGRGFISGAGETELQLQRRRILDRRSHLLSQIEEVRRTRALQRAARRRRGGLDGQGLDTVAVVGYTNAGKSTLISALSNTDLYSNERLFATLDPRLKSVVLPSGRKILLSDTVGFISDLPVQLVEAFHSTLEEVVEADLLVHVIDCTAPNLDEHRTTVLQVLQQIGVSKEKLQNMIEVWNKIDYEEEEMGDDGEYLDDKEEAELSSFSGAENEDAESNTPEGEQVDNHGDNDVEDEVALLSARDTNEVIDDKQDDYSDGWLLSGNDWDSMDDKNSSLMYWKTISARESASSNPCKIEKDSQSQTEHTHVKISALTGVGLQELLEIIDIRLKTQDEKLKSQRVVEASSIFDRKWRPPREEDSKVGS